LITELEDKLSVTIDANDENKQTILNIKWDYETGS